MRPIALSVIGASSIADFVPTSVITCWRSD
jgi:hypothetical protein